MRGVGVRACHGSRDLIAYYLLHGDVVGCLETVSNPANATSSDEFVDRAGERRLDRRAVAPPAEDARGSLLQLGARRCAGFVDKAGDGLGEFDVRNGLDVAQRTRVIIDRAAYDAVALLREAERVSSADKRPRPDEGT